MASVRSTYGERVARVPGAPDFAIENHLSLVLVRPLTEAAQVWLDENVANPETQWFGGALVCEPRYVDDLVAGIEGDGLVVG